MLRDQRRLWTARGVVMTVVGIAILIAYALGWFQRPVN